MDNNLKSKLNIFTEEIEERTIQFLWEIRKIKSAQGRNNFKKIDENLDKMSDLVLDIITEYYQARRNHQDKTEKKQDNLPDENNFFLDL